MTRPLVAEHDGAIAHMMAVREALPVSRILKRERLDELIAAGGAPAIGHGRANLEIMKGRALFAGWNAEEYRKAGLDVDYALTQAWLHRQAYLIRSGQLDVANDVTGRTFR